MKNILFILMLVLLFPLASMAEDEEERERDRPPTPFELAAESDYVVMARLLIYEYEQRRDIPVEGKTWFDVLVPYKVPRPVNRLRVVEEGFGDDKCYFDDIALYEDMPRYLLFLITDDEGDVRGHPDVCALPILVTTDNRYVVRWPITRVTLDDDVEDLVQEFEFHGTGAFIDLSEMTSLRREDTIEELDLVQIERGKYRYTRGILLEDFRQLLGAENLTRDRIQRGGR
jgi:hypothetical protein